MTGNSVDNLHGLVDKERDVAPVVGGADELDMVQSKWGWRVAAGAGPAPRLQ